MADTKLTKNAPSSLENYSLHQSGSTVNASNYPSYQPYMTEPYSGGLPQSSNYEVNISGGPAHGSVNVKDKK